MVMDYYHAQLEEALNDDFDEDHFAQQMIDVSAKMMQDFYDDDIGASSSCHGGSLTGKHGNIDRERASKHTKLMRVYFNDPPCYPSDEFKRRCHMRTSLFTRIMRVVCKNDVYFTQQYDVAN